MSAYSVCIYYIYLYMYIQSQAVHVSQYHTMYSPHARTKRPVRSFNLLRLYCLDACMTHSNLLKRRTGQLVIVLKGKPNTRAVVYYVIQCLMLSAMIGKGRVAWDTYVRHWEAVTGETGTLRTNVPTVSGDEWRVRTVVGLGMGR